MKSHHSGNIVPESSSRIRIASKHDDDDGDDDRATDRDEPHWPLHSTTCYKVPRVGTYDRPTPVWMKARSTNITTSTASSIYGVRRAAFAGATPSVYVSCSRKHSPHPFQTGSEVVSSDVIILFNYCLLASNAVTEFLVKR